MPCRQEAVKILKCEEKDQHVHIQAFICIAGSYEILALN